MADRRSLLVACSEKQRIQMKILDILFSRFSTYRKWQGGTWFYIAHVRRDDYGVIHQWKRIPPKSQQVGFCDYIEKTETYP